MVNKIEICRALVSAVNAVNESDLPDIKKISIENTLLQLRQDIVDGDLYEGAAILDEIREIAKMQTSDDFIFTFNDAEILDVLRKHIEEIVGQFPREVSIEITHTVSRFDLSPGEVIKAMDFLSPEDRLTVIGAYCTSCGSNNPGCQCGNDE